MLSIIAPRPGTPPGTRRRPPAREFQVRTYPQGGGRSGAVLVLDDDLVSGRSTARFIRARMGRDVLIARTIHQAECLLRFGPAPSVIVTDFELQTPENGVHFVERSRRYCHIPAIIFTGAPALASRALAESRLDSQVAVVSRDGGLNVLAQWFETLPGAVQQSA